jgi:glycosyltransferase involved in cell wall biosynthesis
VPTALAVAPYLASFHTQHKDRGFLAEVARNFPAARGTTKPRRKKLWFTDTLTEVNGVARSTCAVAEVARRRGAALTVVSCSEAPPPSDLPVAHFQPTAAFDLPEYPELRLPVPPMLEMLAYCEREMPSEIIISTPGPVGLIGLVAAELFGIPAVGIYHTDFPAYVRHLTASPMLEGVAWAYMRWFFGRMERLFVRSQASADDLVRGGFEAASMQVLPAGVDARLFHPERRQNDFWRLRGLQGETTLLYVGRVSKEKNLDLLLTAFEQLSAEQPEVTLAIVGDGPQLAELRARVDHPRVLLTGYLEGDQLATAYASSDLFVFPSATDTFGNAILEAHASGLPAVVANQGGPPEIVEASGAGATFDPADPCDLLAALRPLLQDPAHRHALGHRAREYARGAGWEQVFEQLWHTPGDPTPARTLHPMEEWWADLARVGA